MPFRIVVLGGYGHFGGRIARSLAGEPRIELVVAGRNQAAAADFSSQLAGGASRCEAVALDHRASDFASRLRALQPNLVIHTCGPFQGQSYHVARAAIESGAHYLDLADSRAFVSGIACMDRAARERGVVVAAGASTLPALSAAVVEYLRSGFKRIDTIVISIAPGQRTTRGLGTMQSVLSYCGRPFQEWNDGRWRRVHGWQGLRRQRLPTFGTRWAARCDVPDLELMPNWYPTLRAVRFDASLEFFAAHIGLWLLSWLVRAGLVRRPESWAQSVLLLARPLDRFGSDNGAMHVGIAGIGREGTRLRRDWELVARRGDGPEIPATPALVIAKKLARGERFASGARPCHGMMTLEDFDAAVRHLHICWHVYDATQP